MSDLQCRQGGAGVSGSHSHLFEAGAMKRASSQSGGRAESSGYQLSVLEDSRYGRTYDESLRKEEIQDAIPILSFAEELDAR